MRNGGKPGWKRDSEERMKMGEEGKGVGERTFSPTTSDDPKAGAQFTGLKMALGQAGSPEAEKEMRRERQVW